MMKTIGLGGGGFEDSLGQSAVLSLRSSVCSLRARCGAGVSHPVVPVPRPWHMARGARHTAHGRRSSVCSLRERL